MDRITETNIRAYDSTAKEYHDNTKNLEPIQVEMREEFIDLLHKGARILDIGCGPGRDAKFFSDRGMQALGIDLSPNMLKMAKRLAPKARFERMGFLDISFEEESFDGAWCDAGIVCIAKRDADNFLAGINRALNPKGILYINVKEGLGEGFELDRRYNNERYFSYYQEDEMKQHLESSGFGILKVVRPRLESRYHTHQWINYFCRKDQDPAAR